MKGEIVVGLDIGTTKIATVIGEVDDNEEIKIIGVGCVPSEGLRKGVVINIDKTVKSIVKSVEEAELIAGVDVEEVFVGIAGDHIRSVNSKGVIAVSRNDHEITKADVNRVIDAAKAVAIPMDREILHVLPQEFIIDNQPGIKEPIGMSGVRLEAEVHIVTGAVTSAQNIFKSVEKAGLKVVDLVLEPLASSYAVLTNDEKELGVALLDFGGGTVDIALFFEESIRHTAVIGLGGNNITSDIAIGLRTPLEQAEEIKKRYGYAVSREMDEEPIVVPGVGGRAEREISRSVLTAIIEPRLEEIFQLAQREIKKTEYADMLAAGIVLTGGGAMMQGATELAEQIFDCPVKLGYPRVCGGLKDAAQHPCHATGVGLVYYGLGYLKSQFEEGQFHSQGDMFQPILSRMKEWVKEFF